MATGLTKTALTRHLAEKLELTNKQSAAFLDLLAETAIKETKKNGVFVIPGIGRLVKAGAHRSQPADRRGHQDQGQDSGQVPRGQGCEGRYRTDQEVALHSSFPIM
jgi:nucleoid DNA-binding protein